MKKYKCSICGKTHPVYSRLESPLPTIISDIPTEERSTRVLENLGLYLIDRKIAVIQGQMRINLEGNQSPIFIWDVWCSISPHDFISNIQTFDTHGNFIVKGKIESELLFYENTLGLDVEIEFNTFEENPIIYITEDSQIKKDQDHPITNKRVVEIMQFIHHNELYTDPIIYEESFSKRLREELEKVKIEYKQHRRSLITNISASNMILFQIIPRRLLESTNDNGFGYGLHLPFDKQDDENSIFRESLEKDSIVEDFILLDVDGIPTYQSDCNQDVHKVNRIAIQLIETVFEQSLELTAVNSFEI